MVSGYVGKQGILNQDVCNDELDFYLEEFVRKGYVIFRSSFSREEIEELRNKVNDIRVIQEKEFGCDLDLINDRNIVRSLPEYDKTFLKVAFEPSLISFAKSILGHYFVLIYQNGVFNLKDTKIFESGKWHRDLNYQHWTCDKSIAINALLCLDPFNAETGGTEVLPGSHLFSSFPSDRFVLNNGIGCVAEPGFWIVMNSMLYHQTGINTTDSFRYGINQMYGLPFVAPHVDFDEMFSAIDLESFMQSFGRDYVEGFLGGRWNPASSSVNWRRKRINKVR